MKKIKFNFSTLAKISLVLILLGFFGKKSRAAESPANSQVQIEARK